jgi:RNA polymerase sigma-70 factor (ECF subfamily)
MSLRIAKNLAIDEIRKRREEPGEPDEHANEMSLNAELSVPDPLLRHRIAECLQKLPAQPSMALQARIFSEGAEPDAILAERCQMRPNTFLQNVTRARKLLAQCLQTFGIVLPGVATQTSSAEVPL